MIDLHSHIIHGIDDGAKSLEDSLEMLRIASQDGIKKIFATPHYYSGRFEVHRDEVRLLVEELNRLALEEGIDIEVLQGSEVFLDRNILKLHDSGAISTLNASRYILIEFPFEGPQDFALDMIYELRLKGLVPVIAHPERYTSFIKKPSGINEFLKEGCLLQLNAGSISGMFGKSVQELACLLLRHGAVSFLGSDAHSPNGRRPELRKSFDIIQEKYIKYTEVLNNSVEKLINNHEIPIAWERIEEKKSILHIFRR